MSERAIPASAGIDGWDRIAIRQRDEPLVSLSRYSDRIRVKPVYYESGIPGAIEDVLLREGVAERLLKAAAGLPVGWRFLLWDGWRPKAVQQHLYDGFQRTLRAENPTLDEASLAKLTATYVSLPNDSAERPSPHLTGGSIDLTLLDADGREVDMGTAFDDFSERARTAYYERDGLPASDRRRRDNRRMLYELLTGAGFSNYYEEWWHYDYGNQFWARTSGRQEAIYGAASL